MLGYQQGDPIATSALIRQVSPLLLRFFASQSGSRAEAEDLLQDTWLQIHRARHTHRPGEPAAAGADRGAYLAGLATNLGNPKAGVFAVSLIPQFILPGGHVFASGVLLGVTWAVTSASWYLVFVWVVDRGRSFVSRPSVTTWLHGITGTVLLMLGVAVVGSV